MSNKKDIENVTSEWSKNVCNFLNELDSIPKEILETRPEFLKLKEFSERYKRIFQNNIL